MESAMFSICSREFWDESAEIVANLHHQRKFFAFSRGTAFRRGEPA